jgi:hypothetical protein
MNRTEQNTIARLLKIFPAFYNALRFITVFTTARYLLLSQAGRIQSTPSYPVYLASILILYYVIWRKPHNEELHNMYSSPSIIRII